MTKGLQVSALALAFVLKKVVMNIPNANTTTSTNETLSHTLIHIGNALLGHKYKWSCSKDGHLLKHRVEWEILRSAENKAIFQVAMRRDEGQRENRKWRQRSAASDCSNRAR